MNIGSHDLNPTPRPLFQWHTHYTELLRLKNLNYCELHEQF